MEKWVEGSFRCRKMSSGTPLSLEPTIVNYWNQDDRKGRKCWESGPVSILTGQKKKRVAYGGKKCVFRSDRNVGKEGQERSAIGNEFQIVGAAKVNERRPFAERM